MERFNYPTIKAVRRETSELMLMLVAESYGSKRDEQEELDEQRQEVEQRGG